MDTLSKRRRKASKEQKSCNKEDAKGLYQRGKQNRSSTKRAAESYYTALQTTA